MKTNSRLLTIFVTIALGVTSASSKHVGDWQTFESPTTTNKTNDSEMLTEKTNHSDPRYADDPEPSLRTPLAVYTVPLSARVTLTPLGLRSLHQVYNACIINDEKAMEVFTSHAVYQPLDYIKYSEVPERLLKYFLVKATWMDAKKTCEDDGAALYSFDHSVQLDSAVANFYPLLLPWIDVQKARVDGGSMLCGYLLGPAPDKSSLRWDDCNTQHEFICQKHATPATAKSLRASRKLVTLFDFLNTFAAQDQAVAKFLNPLINAAVLRSTQLTPTQSLDVSALVEESQNFNFVVIPGIISMLANTSVLSRDQTQKIKQAAEQGVFLYSQLQILSTNYSTQLNFSESQRQAVADLGAEADSFYGIIASIASEKQSTVSKEQATQLQEIIAQTKILIEEATIAFSLTKSMPTTIITKTLGKAIFSIPQSLGLFLAQSQSYFALMGPLFTAGISIPNALTPEQVTELASVATTGQTFLFATMPNVVTMLNLNPLLTSSQIQNMQMALTQGVALLNSTENNIINLLAPPLNLSQTQIQLIRDIYEQGLAYYVAMQAVFSSQLSQPSPTPEQVLILENSQTAYQDLIVTAIGEFSDLAATATPTTETTTIAALPYASLAQILQGHLRLNKDFFEMMEPMLLLAMSQTSLLSAVQMLQLQNLDTQIPIVLSAEIPGQITLLSNAPSLSPTQITQLQEILVQSIALLDNTTRILNSIAPLFDLNADFLQAVNNFIAKDKSLFNELQSIFSNPNVQPTITADNLAQLQEILTQGQILLNIANGLLYGTTTTSATTVAPLSTLAQVFADFLAANQDYFQLIQTILLSHNTQTNLLTPGQLQQIQTVAAQGQDLLTLSMPNVFTLLSTTPILNPDQILQVKTAYSQAGNLMDAFNVILNTTAPILGIPPAIQQVGRSINSQSQSFASTMLDIFADPIAQPSINPIQKVELQDALSQFRILVNAANSLLSATTTTTTSSTTTVAPLSSLAQVFADFLAANQDYFQLIQTVLVSPSIQTNLLTPGQLQQIQTVAAQGQDLLTVSMPNVFTLLSTTPILNPDQILQVKNAYSQAGNLVDAFNDILNTTAPILGISPAIQQVGRSINSQSQSFVATMLDIFADPIAQPSINPTQKEQLQGALSQFRTLINAANSLLSAITTSSTTTFAPLSSLAQVFADFLAANQDYFNLMQPILLAASTQTNLLTPAQLQQIQTVAAQGQNLLTVAMPNVFTLLSTIPILNPDQILQVKSSYSQAAAVLEATNDILNTAAPILGISPAIQQVGRSINSQSQSFVATMLDIFADPIAQPSINPTQKEQLQGALSQFRTLINAANSLLSIITTTTTTTMPTTTTSPLPTLAQLIATIETVISGAFNPYVQMLSAANMQALSPIEQAQIEAAILQSQNLESQTASILSILSTNPTLTPALVQQLKDHFAQRLTLMTALKCIVIELGQKAGLSTWLQQKIVNMAGVSIKGNAAILGLLGNPNSQSISAAQFALIQGLLAEIQAAINAVTNSFTTTTSSTTTPATTATTTTVTTPSTTSSTTRRPSTNHGTTHSRPRPTTRPPSHGNNHEHHQHHQHHHELSPIEGYLLLSRIQGVMAELQLLIGKLHSSYVALRTDTSLRSQHENLINKLLSLRTREAEIQAREVTMSAQEQEAISSKLEEAQKHLRKLNSDQSMLARYLTTKSGDQQLITVFLMKTINVLEPFF